MEYILLNDFLKGWYQFVFNDDVEEYNLLWAYQLLKYLKHSVNLISKNPK